MGWFYYDVEVYHSFFFHYTPFLVQKTFFFCLKLVSRISSLISKAKLKQIFLAVKFFYNPSDFGWLAAFTFFHFLAITLIGVGNFHVQVKPRANFRAETQSNTYFMTSSWKKRAEKNLRECMCWSKARVRLSTRAREINRKNSFRQEIFPCSVCLSIDTQPLSPKQLCKIFLLCSSFSSRLSLSPNM